MTTPTFSSECDFVMGFGKALLPVNLEVATLVVAEILKRNPKFWGAPLA